MTNKSDGEEGEEDNEFHFCSKEVQAKISAFFEFIALGKNYSNSIYFRLALYF